MAFLAKNQTNPLIIDVTGYTPYSAARLRRAQESKSADSKTRQRDAAIRDYWIRRNYLEDVENYVVRHHKDLFRSRWECATDKKGLYSRIKWEMNKVYEKRKQELEQRRNRLSDMLREEEQMYLKEISMPPETLEGRKQKLESRYEHLRNEKEKERRAIAEEKKEQQFRLNCDELRCRVSKKTRDQIYVEGQELGQVKDHLVKEKDKEEEMYAKLWIKDSQAKEERENDEKCQTTARNMEYKNYIQEQIEEGELKKLKDAEVKEEEAKLLVEQRRLMDLEKDWIAAQKKKKQERFKKGLDKCLRNKLKRQTKEVQEDLMLDLYFLKQIAGTELDDRIKERQKQKALWKEQQQYLKYLSDRIKEEAEFERKLDQMYQEELDKMWEQREQEWAEDKKRQEELNKQMLQLRYEQIQQKLEHSRQVQKLRSLYGEEVQKQAERDRLEDAEKRKQIREKNCQYQKELIQQIKEKKEEASRKALEKKREYETCKKEEEEFEKRLSNILADPELHNLHPYRTRKFSVATEKI